MQFNILNIKYIPKSTILLVHFYPNYIPFSEIKIPQQSHSECPNISAFSTNSCS